MLQSKLPLMAIDDVKDHDDFGKISESQRRLDSKT